ncbi:MAG: hypothetical protein MI702_13250, partial [Chlorobiales bacterium]|nr:hypothetical protein [Chlorobiales bacterium]
EAGVLNVERQELLSHLLSDGIDKLGPDVRAALQEVLSQNQRTMDSVRRQKKQLTHKSQRLRVAADAVRNYRINSYPARRQTDSGTPEERQ